PHDASLELTAEWLRGVFTPGCWVRVQMGLVLGVNTDPIPDVAVVPGSPRTLTQTPRSALLVVEVAESSLAYDTGEKASLYAAAGIEDYWVIDVEHRRLLVFRGPMADPNQKYGHRYAQVAALDPA